MAIKRELVWFAVQVGPDGTLDTLRANFRTADTDENTVSSRDREINVVPQLRAAIEPLVTIVLEKLANDTRTVTRPSA